MPERPPFVVKRGARKPRCLVEETIRLTQCNLRKLVRLVWSSKQRPSHVHKFSDLLWKGFQKDALKTAWIQYISYMKDTVKRTIGERAFLLHMLFGVVLRLPFQSVLHAMVASSCSVFNRVSLGVRSLVPIYILRDSIKGHSMCCYYNVVIIELWAIVDASLRSWSLSWRIGDKWNPVKCKGFSRIKILRRGKPPLFVFFLPNAKNLSLF